MRAFVLPLILLVPAACRDARTSSLTTELRVEPAQLDFGEVPVGAVVTRTVQVTNPTRSPAELDPQVDGSFELVGAAQPRTIPSGARGSLQLRFAPTHPGPETGTLTLGEGIRIPLRGSARAAPTCESADPCRASRFDPAQGLCTETPLPDGAACQTACIAQGTCLQGRCIGAAQSCDDGDLCTQDACASDGSCLHAPAQCPEPGNPCLAAVCDPRTGCSQTPVPEGTPCGRTGCDVQDVCIAGACVARVPPDGARCGAPSPCQAQGVCQARACQRPPKDTLQLLWSYLPASHSFEGWLVMDPVGNLYFDETSGVPTPGVVVDSLDADGTLRWQSQRMGPLHGFHAQAAFGGRLYGTWVSELVALDAATGAELWRVDLAPLLKDEIPELPPEYLGTYRFLIAQVFDPGDGTVGAAINYRTEWFTGGGGWIVRVDPQTGAVVDHWLAGDGVASVLPDPGPGLLYLSVLKRRSDNVVLAGAGAYEPEGTLRWQLPQVQSSETPVLATVDRLFVSRGGGEAGAGVGTVMLDARTGESLLEESPAPSIAVPNVLPGPDGTSAIMVCTQRAPDYGLRYDLHALTLADGAELWRQPLTTTTLPDPGKRSFVQPPRRAPGGDVLLTRQLAGPTPAEDTYSLLDFTPDGDLVFDCPFPGAPAAALGQWGLAGEKLIGVDRTGRVSAFDLRPR